jgi:transposase InsO family protein
VPHAVLASLVAPEVYDLGGQKGLSKISMLKSLLRLHLHFGHATVGKLQGFLRTAGAPAETIRLVPEAVHNCDSCPVLQKPVRPSKVTADHPQTFNDRLQIDLIYYPYAKHRKYVVHITDTYSRLSGGRLVSGRDAEQVTRAFLSDWVKPYGVPNTIRYDEGSEFKNKLFDQLCTRYHIRLDPVPPEIKSKVGVVERANGILGILIGKVKAELPSTPDEIIVDMAIHARNEQTNVNGYSPFQLVFGKNPRLRGR